MLLVLVFALASLAASTQPPSIGYEDAIAGILIPSVLSEFHRTVAALQEITVPLVAFTNQLLDPLRSLDSGREMAAERWRSIRGICLADFLVSVRQLAIIPLQDTTRPLFARINSLDSMLDAETDLVVRLNEDPVYGMRDFRMTSMRELFRIVLEKMLRRC